MNNDFNNITVGFIGFGLIGGSIARALKSKTSCTIIAYSRSKQPLLAAKSDSNIDIILDDITEDFKKCDFIFLCTPVEYNNHYLSKIAPFINEECILTDVGSVKSPIHKEVSSLGLEDCFIGGHPMAGSEKTGYTNSSASLLNGAIYAVTPTPKTTQFKLNRYTDLVELIGAAPLVMDCSTHDHSVAGISHVPHIIAGALVNLVEDNDDNSHNMHRMAAGGFKDITRIASSSPEVWQQICSSNKDAICKLMREYIASLTAITDKLEANDATVIADLFVKSKAYRDTF